MYVLRGEQLQRGGNQSRDEKTPREGTPPPRWHTSSSSNKYSETLQVELCVTATALQRCRFFNKYIVMNLHVSFRPGPPALKLSLVLFLSPAFGCAN